MVTGVSNLPHNCISVLIETKLLYKILAIVREMIPGYYVLSKEDQLLDEDVQLEQERVNHDNENDVLKVFGLQKKFRRWFYQNKFVCYT